MQEAIWLRNRVLSQLDVAAGTEDPERRRAALTFVFVGGGYAHLLRGRSRQGRTALDGTGATTREFGWVYFITLRRRIR